MAKLCKHLMEFRDSGRVGIDNEPFYADNAIVLFDEVKKMTEVIVQPL